MKDTRLLTLFNRAIEETITSEEREELFLLMADKENQHEVEELFGQTWVDFQAKTPVFENDETSKMLMRILNESEDVASDRPRRMMRPWRMFAAACVLLMMTVFLFLEVPKNIPELSLAQSTDHSENIPKTTSATITLGDGSTIVLDDTSEGIIRTETGTNIHKSKGGQIRYTSPDVMGETEMVYNTIHIPRGGDYQLILSDGTEVHLNSESSLQYPIHFAGHLREVTLTGEAYFSVSHQSKDKKAIPFLVKTSTQKVEVLGTLFNVNAYKDEQVKTTLIEGSVRIHPRAGKAVLLRPGQAAINKTGSPAIKVIKADVDGELAWRSGYFIFNDEEMESIMERVARWYDVDVEYRGNARNKRIGGVFQKSKSLSQLLENFKETGLIDFKIEGRRVVVISK